MEFFKKSDKEALLIMTQFTNLINQRLFNEQMNLAFLDKDESFPDPYILARNAVIKTYVDRLLS